MNKRYFWFSVRDGSLVGLEETFTVNHAEYGLNRKGAWGAVEGYATEEEAIKHYKELKEKRPYDWRIPDDVILLAEYSL